MISKAWDMNKDAHTGYGWDSSLAFARVLFVLIIPCFVRLVSRIFAVDCRGCSMRCSNPRENVLLEVPRVEFRSLTLVSYKALKRRWPRGMNVSVRSRSTGGIEVQPFLLTIPQVMQCMALGRNKIYDLINKEGLPVLQFGRAVRISRTTLEQWLEQREQDRSVVY